MLYAVGSTAKPQTRLAFTFKSIDYVLLSLTAAIVTLSAVVSSLSKSRYSHDVAGVSSVTSAWTLHDLTIPDRLTGFFLNLARVTYQLLLFPLSTYKKDMWVPSIFQSKFATGGGTSYSLIEQHTHDSAYPSWIVLSLLAICFVSAIYITFCRRDILREYFMAKPASISLAILLMTSILALVVIFWNIAYQPWMSRFLGCFYIPLFPIMAYQLGIVLVTATKKFSFGKGPVFVCLTIVFVFVSGNFINSLNAVDSQVNIPRLMPGLNGNPQSSYKAHLTAKGISSMEIERLIDQLHATKYKSLVLCHEENTWNLVPLYEASMNASFNGKNLSTQKIALCPAGEKGILKRALNGVTYVILP